MPHQHKAEPGTRPEPHPNLGAVQDEVGRLTARLEGWIDPQKPYTAISTEEIRDVQVRLGVLYDMVLEVVG